MATGFFCGLLPTGLCGRRVALTSQVIAGQTCVCRVANHFLLGLYVASTPLDEWPQFSSCLPHTHAYTILVHGEWESRAESQGSSPGRNEKGFVTCQPLT